MNSPQIIVITKAIAVLAFLIFKHWFVMQDISNWLVLIFLLQNVFHNVQEDIMLILQLKPALIILNIFQLHKIMDVNYKLIKDPVNHYYFYE